MAVLTQAILPNRGGDNGLLTIAVPDTSDEVEEDLFARAYLSLPAGGGAFHVTAEYVNLTAGNPEVMDAQCYFDVISETDQDKILYNAQMLWDNENRSEGTFWVSPFAHSMEIILPFYVKDSGTTAIGGLRVTESLRYRLWLLLLYLFICCLFWCYIRLIAPKTEKEKLVLLTLAGILFFASLPLFTKGCYDTRDMLFHLKRIGTMAQELSRGNFPVRYEPCAANGYGYVEHIFYPNLFLYFPAFLCMLDVPLYVCYKIYIFFFNAVTCGIAYWSYRRIFSSRAIGILGCAVYTLAIYRIFNLYGLNAAGEFSAKAFLPLLCYGIWKLGEERKGNGYAFMDILPLVVSGTGIVYSHVITCEILVIFLLVFFLLNWRTYGNPRRLWALGRAGLLVLGCCASFLIPCADGLRMNLDVNRYDGVTHSVLLENFALPVSGLFRVVYDEEYYAAVAGMITLAGLFLFMICMIYRKRWKLRETKGYREICCAAVLTVTALWMCTEWFPWGYVAYVSKRLLWLLAVVQFPYRYLTVVMTLMTFLICYSVRTVSVHARQYFKGQTRRTMQTVLTVCLIGLCMFESLLYIDGYVLERDITNRAYLDNEINYALGLRDYVPEGVHSQDFCTRDIVCGSEQLHITDFHAQGDEKYCTVVNESGEGWAELPIFAYDQMRVTDTETGQELSFITGDRGRMRISVPSGFAGTLKIYFQVPVLWRVADLISMVSLIGCGAAVFVHLSVRKRVRSGK